MSSSIDAMPQAPSEDEREVVIDVRNLGKSYQLYTKPQHRLWQGLLRGRKTFYKEHWVLKNITFQVRRGETVGIIGRNGAGKSTLLQMLCGTLSNSTGDCTVRGRVAALLELGAGFDPNFTGHENIYINASILGLTPQQIDARYDSIVRFADIGEFIDQPVKTYSSGMYVRLAFAIIVHVDADILVIDEALAVGDAFFKQKCMRFLRDFQTSGTILFVSHDTGAIVNFCNHAIWLDHGAVRMQGSPKEITEHYLAGVYASQQGESAITQPDPEPKVAAAEPARRDFRKPLIDGSTLRNDLEIFTFDPEAAGFGAGGIRILDVSIRDPGGTPLSWIVGGEDVVVSLTARCHQDVESPIFGFNVKDRLGQILFSDNSYTSHRDRHLQYPQGSLLMASFRFTMPILPKGEFSIGAAVAEGTQSHHVQHHWIHDALIFRSHRSSILNGLVGIPMQDIVIEAIDERRSD